MPDSPNAAPVSASLVRRVAQGVRYAVSGVTPNDWFGPAQPIQPMAQDQAQGRVLDYRVGYNLQLRPREEEPIGFAQLRGLADASNFLRLVIETRKDQMERLSWSVQSRLGTIGQPSDTRIAGIEAFLRKPDGCNNWASWLRQVLEELLVTDAVALYRRRDAGGRLYALQQIDGATIKRLIDASGLTPPPPDPAYQQILHGLPAVDYTADQLLYLPRNKRIHKLYGYSPVEQVVMTVNIALRRQAAQLNYFTEGNIPEALVSCPPDWRPAQIREMQEIFDDMLRGNLAERSGAKFVPGGLNVQFTKDALLKDEFDEWLARIICYAFSVPPTAFVRQMNRATADSAQQTGMQEGLAPLQNWVKALVDRVLEEDFASPDLEFAWNEEKALSASEAMTVNTGYVAAGLKTRNEIRADLGLPPLPGGDVALVTAGTGLVPIMATPQVAKYDFSQPRNPAGQSDGGRWTSGSGGTQVTTSSSDDSGSFSTSHALSGNVTNVQTAADLTADIDYTVRSKIIQMAEKNVGSEEWADDVANGLFPPGKDKCNLFVFQVAADAGANPGTPNGTIFHIYPPTAAQWADANYPIPGWYVLSSTETPQAGDVVAQPIHYRNGPTGHVMIIGPNDTVIGTGKDGIIEQVPMPDKLGPIPLGGMVFRRWKSKG